MKKEITNGDSENLDDLADVGVNSEAVRQARLK